MRFLAPAALLLLLAFFAASEFALIRLRPTRVQLLEADGERGATAVARLQRRLRRALVATQLGMTLALVALGWSGRGLAERWGSGAAGRWLGQVWLDVLVFLGLVVLATLLGGLVPKAWVLHRPEATALRLAPVLEAVMRSLGPVLVLLERLGNGLLRLLGLPRNWDELVPALSAGELETPPLHAEGESVSKCLQSALIFELKTTQARDDHGPSPVNSPADSAGLPTHRNYSHHPRWDQQHPPRLLFQ